MSWNAMISSSSKSLREGILPSTILQNMQFGSWDMGGLRGQAGMGRRSLNAIQPRRQR